MTGLAPRLSPSLLMPPLPVRALLFLITLVAAEAAPVTGWVATNGNTGFSGDSEAGDSPVTTDADAETIVGSFAATHLGVGDAIRLERRVVIAGAFHQ